MAKYKVNIVGVDTSKLKTIPCAKTIELIKKYKENRDSILFDEIVQGNLKLVLLVVNKYGKKVDLKEFAIHHRFDGLVGLVPRELHESIHHYGYFYRLGH